MSRRVLGAIAVVALFGGPDVSAQTFRDAASPGVTVQRDVRPSQPPPLPTPLPVQPGPGRPGHHAPMPDGTVDLFRAGPHTYAPGYNRRQHRVPYYGLAVPYAVGPSYYAPYLPEAGSATIESPYASGEITGFLRLEIEPDTAQVFLDGYFVGGAEDFGTALYPLAAGVHRVELRASGFESVIFDVRVRPYETATFTHALQRAAAPDAPAAAAAMVRPAAPKTLYVIPRCYAGDKRPSASALPAGCDLRAMRTIPPARP